MSEPTIVGYAATFYDGTCATEYELFPNCFERIDPRAFDTVIRENVDVACLVNHDKNLVLARRSAGSLFMRTDRVGLNIEAYPADTNAGRDALANVQARNLAGMSFTFTVEDEKWSAENGRDIRLVLNVGEGLYDVGPVTFPAYKSTTAQIGEGDRKRSLAIAGYAKRAAEVTTHNTREKTNVQRLIEHAGQRRDSQREQILANAQRLLTAKRAAIVRDTERIGSIRDPRERELCERAIEAANVELAIRECGLREVRG